METIVSIAVPVATAVLGFAFWLAALSKDAGKNGGDEAKDATHEVENDSSSNHRV